MKIKFFLSLICISLIPILSVGQHTYPQNDFISPVPIPISLSGNFSELRRSHFHAGLDIRTGGQEGVPVIAIADGLVSRISISASGYGRMLFLEHDNGYTSGYAHLSAFAPALAVFVKKMQYKEESFELNLNPLSKEFRFKQGDTIAFSGNSGHSLAPHLHFEIRETESKWLINPLLFGYKLEDNIKPRMLRVRLYPLDNLSAIQVEYYGKNGTYNRNYFKPFVLRLIKSNGDYKLSGVKAIRAKGKFGMAVECKDQINGSGNILDIYNLYLAINGRTIYSQKRDYYSPDHTRYINAHRDYEAKVSLHKNFQRLFVLPNNKLAFYDILDNNGIVNMNFGDSLNIQVTAIDFFKNQVDLKFLLQYFDIADSLIPQDTDTNFKKIFYFDRPNIFKTDDIELSFPEFSFYEDIKFHHSTRDRRSNMYSDIHTIHNYKVAVQYYYTIRINAEKLPKEYQPKALIAQIGANDSYWTIGGEYQNGFVVAKNREFADYAIMVDTIAPVIQTLNFWNNSNLTWKKDMRVSMYDRLSGIESYRASIDGKWILMEDDKKRKLLIHTFDNRADGKEHYFKLLVTDKKENTREINIKFIR
ncbi:MAG: M23 family metallopeptidase [Bacteroidetes bacterium]|nr:M23 family metallopeptidase [Bacteroidota bacterium]